LFVEEEVQAVVVVDNDDQVRVLLLQPFLRRHVTVEETLPVRFLLQIVGNGVADCRDVRAGDAAENFSHSSNLHVVQVVLPVPGPSPAAWPGTPWWECPGKQRRSPARKYRAECTSWRGSKCSRPCAACRGSPASARLPCTCR